MRAAPIVLALTVAACGGLHAIDAPGPARLGGCLTLPDAGAAAGVPVFLVSDGGVAAEGRSGADGCYRLEDVPSGRALVVANDFRGLGLLEPVRLYAGERLELPRRVLYSLTLNPVLPGLRGVGAGEALGEIDGRSWTAADPDSGVFRLFLDGKVRTVDAETGATIDRPTCVRSTVAATPPERASSGEPTEMTALSWNDGGVPVPLPDGGNGWQNLVATETAFVATAVQRQGASTTSVGAVYGAQGTVTPIGSTACHLFGDGSCARLSVSSGVVTLARWEPASAPTVTDSPIPPGATVVIALMRDDGRAFAVVTTEAEGAKAWWYSPTSSLLMQVAAFPGLQAETGADPDFGLAGRVRRLTFDLVDASGARRWALFDLAKGTVQTVPLPSAPLSGTRVLLAGDAETADVTRAWTTPGAPGTFEVVIAEHLGARALVRHVTVPARSAPDYAYPENPFRPTLGLLNAPEAGLEVFTVDDAPRLLAPGAPLESARPVATLGVAATPVLAAGNSLLTFTSAEDLSRQAFRYDIRRIADELARAP